MMRITIEIDDKHVSTTTTSHLAASIAPPQELLARATEMGATDAGSAPGVAMVATELATAAALDAGSAPEDHAASIESAVDSKPKRIPR